MSKKSEYMKEYRLRPAAFAKEQIRKACYIRSAAGKLSNKKSRYQRMYGISIEQRDTMLAAQGYRCAACGTLDPGSKWGWHTDHNPNKQIGDPGFIRGLLCRGCNTSAHKNASPATLRLLADYLEIH